VLIVVVLVVGGVGGAGWWVFASIRGVFTRPPMGTIQPPGFQPPTIPGFGQPPKPARPAAKAIAPAEFPGVLAELKKGPKTDRLLEIADQLAVTDPTQEQKGKHGALKTLLDLKSKGPDAGLEKKIDRAREDDDITQVSLALNPLLDDADAGNRKVALKAVVKWGTPENAPGVSKIVASDAYTLDPIRKDAFRLLGEWGRETQGSDAVSSVAIPALAGRLPNVHEGPSRELEDALVAFGSKAEDAVLKHHDNFFPNIKLNVCRILEKIGTRKSLGTLEKMKADSRLGTAPETAIRAIESRPAKKGD